MGRIDKRLETSYCSRRLEDVAQPYRRRLPSNEISAPGTALRAWLERYSLTLQKIPRSQQSAIDSQVT
jgi:hypothetical protein